MFIVTYFNSLFFGNTSSNTASPPSQALPPEVNNLKLEEREEGLIEVSSDPKMNAISPHYIEIKDPSTEEIKSSVITPVEDKENSAKENKDTPPKENNDFIANQTEIKKPLKENVMWKKKMKEKQVLAHKLYADDDSSSSKKKSTSFQKKSRQNKEGLFKQQSRYQEHQKNATYQRHK